MSIQDYRKFIASKSVSKSTSGMVPTGMNEFVKDHQIAAIEFALNAGKSASFLDTGLGKSLCELEFARQVSEETGKPVLILTPLAVAGQMIREGQKFGIDARQIREQSEVGKGIMVANYERLPKLDPDCFGGIVLDESSILKSFAGRTRNTLMDAFKDTPFKLAATATPSPNDHTELGNHAEFLGVMRQQEMLSRWFINDTSTASKDWRLKGHATDDFWAWVASWSRCATLPSDLGGDDTGYILPEIDRKIHTIAADRQENIEQGMLFRIPEMSATSFHKEKRLTLMARCERAANLVMSSICSKLAKTTLELPECLGNLNTQKPAAKNTDQTHPSVIAEIPRQDRLKKTKNTCGNTTKTIQTNSKTHRNAVTGTTHQGGKNTKKMPNTGKNAKFLPNQGAISPNETRASSPHTASLKKTMKECSQIRDVFASYAGKNTLKKEAGCCTLTTATALEKLEGYFAQLATPLSERCETIPIDCDPLSPIWKNLADNSWLVFCETNDEQKALEESFGPLAFSVKGSDKLEKKESDILAWIAGDRPIMISKPKIMGFGMNFQHCHNVVFASISFSYEAYYQAVRRVWRFGQEKKVSVNIVIADTEASIWAVVHGKSEKHEEMKRQMSLAMRSAQTQADVRVKYDRPLDLAFPEWIKTEDVT